MNESLDLSGVEESVHTVHSCECGYYSTDRSNYNKHIKRCKWHAGPSTSTPRKPNNQTKASSSTRVNDVSGKDQTHVALPTPAKQVYMCDTCGNNYKTKYGLTLHIKSKHEGNFKHQCSMCQKTFNQSVQYRYHCSKHLKVPMDKCPHCKETFSSHGSLGRHLKTCPNNKDSFEKFYCDMCDASFPHKYSLRYHQRGKHGEKRYTCEGCNRRFGWRSSLKVHQKHCPSTLQAE